VAARAKMAARIWWRSLAVMPTFGGCGPRPCQNRTVFSSMWDSPAPKVIELALNPRTARRPGPGRKRRGLNLMLGTLRTFSDGTAAACKRTTAEPTRSQIPGAVPWALWMVAPNRPEIGACTRICARHGGADCRGEHFFGYESVDALNRQSARRPAKLGEHLTRQIVP